MRRFDLLCISVLMILAVPVAGCGRTPPTFPNTKLTKDLALDVHFALDGEDVTDRETTVSASSERKLAVDFRLVDPRKVPDGIWGVKVVGQTSRGPVLVGRMSSKGSLKGPNAKGEMKFSGSLKMPTKSGQYEIQLVFTHGEEFDVIGRALIVVPE